MQSLYIQITSEIQHSSSCSEIQHFFHFFGPLWESFWLPYSVQFLLKASDYFTPKGAQLNIWPTHWLNTFEYGLKSKNEACFFALQLRFWDLAISSIWAEFIEASSIEISLRDFSVIFFFQHSIGCCFMGVPQIRCFLIKWLHIPIRREIQHDPVSETSHSLASSCQECTLFHTSQIAVMLRNHLQLVGIDASILDYQTSQS